MFIYCKCRGDGLVEINAKSHFDLIMKRQRRNNDFFQINMDFSDEKYGIFVLCGFFF